MVELEFNILRELIINMEQKWANLIE